MTTTKDPHSQAPLDEVAIAQIASGLAPVVLDAGTRGDLKQRVLMAAEKTPMFDSRVVKSNAGVWMPLLPGIEVKALRIDRRERSHTSLWRLAAGARLPEHDHTAEEECLVVAGEIEWSGDVYREGDYLLVGAGFHHTEMRTAAGATLLIRGELSARLEQAFAAFA